MEKTTENLKLGNDVYLFRSDRYIGRYKVEATHGSYICTVCRVGSTMGEAAYSYKLFREILSGGRLNSPDAKLKDSQLQFYYGSLAKKNADERDSINMVIDTLIANYKMSYPDRDSLRKLNYFISKEIKKGYGEQYDGTDSDEERWD